MFWNELPRLIDETHSSKVGEKELSFEDVELGSEAH